jgi:flagellar basal-body rod modification protein FlgD
MIDAVSSTSGQHAAAGALASGAQVSQQQFLTLFIEQLKNQDPLSPLQPDQLTAQLAQFSSLEQLTGINTRLDALAGTAKQTTGSAMLGLLGKQVSIDGGRLPISGAKAPRVDYRLTEAAERVTATVRDADGRPVRVVDLGAQEAGAHAFAFDGRDGTGALLADGSYGVEIVATARGAKVPTPVSLTTLATVDGVDLGSDPPVLLVGGERIPLDQVHEVHEPVSGT